MKDEGTAENSAAQSVRQQRFGKLPERVRPEDMIEEWPAVDHDPARGAYNPDEWLVRYCL
ncbi:hypothetical protein ACFV7R_25855 [Streptomyces sp. NPDC059866]|uniref:hypothetical protein n=1 Tax=Streptomyces sp. NPDC059866 TaxID=3346978 RepID=UPI0036587B87